MRFLGAFTLIVLPLFLILCIRIIATGPLHKRVVGVFLEVLFALVTIACIFGGVVLLFELF